MRTNLANMSPGFADVVASSQSVFRASLTALSRPGRIERVDEDIDIPAPGHKAAGALLLSLLDQDTKVWFSPLLRASPCVSFLRFHTGCVLVDDHAVADFAWCASEAELPELSTFQSGSEEFPDRSCTLVLQVNRLANDRHWLLRGPGINGEAWFDAEISNRVIAERIAMQQEFPRGIDFFLSDGDKLLGLPRSTRMGG